MAVRETVYEAMVGASRPLFGATALVHRPSRQAVRGRRESLARFEAWGESERDPSRRLIWLHSPSVGEGLMAKAILGALRDARPDVQLAFTHFSPSAERMAGTVGADVAGYIPWDTRGPVRRALDALRPSAIAFVRTEVWPVLTREAQRFGTPLFLVNAVLAEDSSRLRWPARRLLTPMYRRLDGVGAVSRDHAGRYERLGVPPDFIRVTGDARFDQVAGRISGRGLLELRERLSEAAAGGEEAGAGGAAVEDVFDALPGELPVIFRLLWDPSRFTLVAGSTWGSDEEKLVPVLGVIRRERRIRVVIAPHEPTRSHLDTLEGRLERAGVRHARLGALVAAGGVAPGVAGLSETSDRRVPDAIIIDRVGILADLYALADLAYVGGGFHAAGLHSVVEPAGLGVPVLFGPNHGNAREAAVLAQRGGGFLVRRAGDIEARIRNLDADRDELAEAGAAAASYVATERGAAARNAAMVLDGLSGSAFRVPGM